MIRRLKEPFDGEKRHYEIKADNPFIVRDMNKCILCGKCIRPVQRSPEEHH